MEEVSNKIRFVDVYIATVGSSVLFNSDCYYENVIDAKIYNFTL